MKAKPVPVYIYGLFDGERCDYVGMTVNEGQRAGYHRRRFAARNPRLEFRVIEKLTRETVRDAERKWIAHYKSVGQAQYNSKPGCSKAIKAHGYGRHIVCNGLRFPSRVEMCRHFGFSVETARKAILFNGGKYRLWRNGKYHLLEFAYAD